MATHSRLEFQKGHLAGLRHYWLWANFGNGAKSRESNVRNGFSILENVGIYYFRAFPWKKFSTVPWGGNHPPFDILGQQFFPWKSAKTVDSYVFEYAESVSDIGFA